MLPDNFTTFLVTTGLFIITPGIDTIFVLNKSIVGGKKSGVYATLGVNAGVLIHTLFAAMGFAVLVAKWTLVFTIVKYAGAVYLLYLGFLQLKKKQDLMQVNDRPKESYSNKNDFFTGFFTNTLNPKVALFFLAFFPQFIAPEQMENPIPFILLGLIYALLGVLWFSTVALFASLFSEKFATHPNAGLWLSKISGVVFILMAIKIALG